MLTKDVVCGMDVECGDNQLVYQGCAYSFCSQQCRERFQAKTLIDTLQTMMGIQAVSAEGDSILITYDLLLVTAEQIEKKLTEIGVQLGEGLAERLRRAFVHYEEESESGNLEVHADDILPIYKTLWRDDV